MSFNSSIAMLGIVVQIDDEENDPTNELRVKVRIPIIHGPLSEEDLPQGSDILRSRSDDDVLPWAQICYPLGTKDPDKHSFLEEDDIVYVMFPRGDTKYPLIIGTTGKKAQR